MKRKTHIRPITLRPHEAVPDAAAVQDRIERRLADRYRVSDAVAGVLAGLAGYGPQMREAR
ncbi:hypothetical protein [Methylobacterium sp. GC_Met_2]|uniref:hypothetical protein n=1 Tax=Methylobacterium sp. GC_Met_2 TaxID=2937376 RepID=UPI00226B4A5D|nr:hypothetical protein [Methylobacterium sp. GC_Met_2]